MKRFRIFQIVALTTVFSMTLAISGVGVAHQALPSTQFSAPAEIRYAVEPSSPQVGDDLLEAMSPTADYTVTLGAWRNLRPTESYLRDVSMLPSTYSIDCSSPDQKSEGWIVGNGGTVLNYCNGVWDHAIIAESIPTTLYGVQAILPTLGVAVGEQGAIMMYLWDRIAKDWVWTKSPIPIGNQVLYQVSMVPDGSGGYTGWVVGAKDASGKGVLVRGTITPIVIDGQDTFTYNWENVTANYPNLPNVNYYWGLQMLSQTNGWAVGGAEGTGGVIIHWDGSTWSHFQTVGSHALIGLHMRSATDGWAVGNYGAIYHFDGTSWTAVNSPTQQFLYDVEFDSSGIGWASGSGNALLTYRGGAWSEVATRTTDQIDFRTMDFTSGHGWLVGFHDSKQIGGHILELEDDIWWAVTPPTDNRLNAVSAIDDNNVWAVGIADELGGTILYWDGKHWRRWFQSDLPIPPADLYAIDMVSPTEGWAAGDPLEEEAPAVFLHWDGTRWAPPRYDSPINVRVNDISMLDGDFGWAAAIDGNAVGKYDRIIADYWTGLHTCGGVFYNLRGISVAPAANSFGWDAWAVGSSLNPVIGKGEHFLRYSDYCGGTPGSYAWDDYQAPADCDTKDLATTLRGIHVTGEASGYAVGEYGNRATIYELDSSWSTYFCQPENDDYNKTNPSSYYGVDVVDESGVAWFGGYYNEPSYHYGKMPYITYIDATGRHWAGDPFPINGINIYHRAIRSIAMVSDTMGWAVGEVEKFSDYSVIYQYPYPNFTLNTTPDFRAVRPGNSTSYTIATNTLGGFNADVTLSVLSTPPGTSIDITPGVIDKDISATVNVSTDVTTPLGVYEIPIVGFSIFRSGDYDIPVYRIVYLRLTVTDNPVHAVTPDHGKAGTVVTITGENFGSDPGPGNRSTPTNHVILAGEQMPTANVISWSNTEIQVRVPDDASLFPLGPTQDIVSVTAGGTASNDDFLFQLENYISEIAITGDDSQGYVVTITGTGLGNDPGVYSRSTYYEHVGLDNSWIPNADVQSWSYNEIVFSVPARTPSGFVTVTSNGYKSNAEWATLSSTGASGQISLPLIVR